jgi:cytosine/adenosine deaminase-related metal-dependent hydrolase
MMTPDEAMRSVVERSAETALDLIDKHGHFLPFALGLDAEGESYWVMADSSEQEAAYDADTWAASIEQQVREMIGDGTLRVVAFAEDVLATFQEDGKRYQMRAIRIDADHAEKAGQRAHLTFEIREGKAQPGELFYMNLPSRFFGDA